VKSEHDGPELGRGVEALRRRIEQTLSMAGTPLRCTDCDRLSSGRATGWTMRRADDGELFALCPECDELEFG
jgi:hypothetical protein